jgi:hypothetical protein
MPAANTDGLINCLRQPRLIRNHPKGNNRNFHPLIKFFCTVTNPATVTKSMGLPALAPVVMVFAEPSGEFYRDMTNPFSLSGHTHLDRFIVTRKSCPSTGTLQKHMPTLIRTATN